MSCCEAEYEHVDKVALLARWALTVEVKAPERR